MFSRCGLVVAAAAVSEVVGWQIHQPRLASDLVRVGEAGEYGLSRTGSRPLFRQKKNRKIYSADHSPPGQSRNRSAMANEPTACGVEDAGLRWVDSSDHRERTNEDRAAARFVCGTATCGVEDAGLRWVDSSDRQLCSYVRQNVEAARLIARSPARSSTKSPTATCGVEDAGLRWVDSSDQRERTNEDRAAARFVFGTATCPPPFFSL